MPHMLRKWGPRWPIYNHPPPPYGFMPHHNFHGKKDEETFDKVEAMIIGGVGVIGIIGVGALIFHLAKKG